MSISDLYQRIVLEHNRAPRNFGALPGHTHAADGANASCGDALRCELRMERGHIGDIRFGGESCAIATAAASMLSERVGGLDVAAVDALRARFDAFLRADGGADELGELVALGELRRHPARMKCAMLPFATLLAALAGEARATTESEWEPLAALDDEPSRNPA